MLGRARNNYWSFLWISNHKCNHKRGGGGCKSTAKPLKKRPPQKWSQSGLNTFHTTERGPCSTNSAFVVLENSQTETGFKTNFLPMKGENSITAYCIVLMFKQAKIWWQVKEILVSKALRIYFHWILTASVKMWLGWWVGAWFWINLGWGEWKCQRVIVTLQC